ncbi:MAG TPA: YdcF family protein [Stellaceae bacterium]|nr:YdcF family protein [Stellaceae bacterium]
MFLLSKLGWALLQPGNLLVLVLLAGFLLLLSSRGRRGKILIGLAALGMVVIAVVPLGSALLLNLEQRFPRPAALPPRLDGILVLGGAVDPRLSQSFGETVFNGSVARVLSATALARRHPEAKLVLIGGEGSVFPSGYPEARATLGFVLDQGIPRDRVILEERSRNTYENAVFAKALVQPKPGQNWLLITSAFHMPRAVASFRAAGWPVIPYPVEFKIDPKAGLRPNFDFLDGLSAITTAGKEWVGLAAYRLLGRTQALFPAPH